MTPTPEPSEDLRRAELIFADWALRAENGDVQPIEELLAAHPELRDELRRHHEDWKLFAPILGKVVPGLIASDAGPVQPSLSGGPDADDEPPTELLARLGIHAPNEGRYRFRSVIGRGGGGIVLKVWDSKLNRPLAMIPFTSNRWLLLPFGPCIGPLDSLASANRECLGRVWSICPR